MNDFENNLKLNHFKFIASDKLIGLKNREFAILQVRSPNKEQLESALKLHNLCEKIEEREKKDQETVFDDNMEKSRKVI